MNQSSSIRNKLKISIQNDVDVQIEDLMTGLKKMGKFIGESKNGCKTQSIIDNQQFLQLHVSKLIAELVQRLNEYQRNFKEMINRNTELIEICKSAEMNFTQFYEEYEFIHSQIYLYNERKIIVQREDPDRDFKLIYDILNPGDD